MRVNDVDLKAADVDEVPASNSKEEDDEPVAKHQMSSST